MPATARPLPTSEVTMLATTTTTTTTTTPLAERLENALAAMTRPAHRLEADARKVCLDYAAEWPTPNVTRAVELAEAGRVSWSAIAGLFERALREALATT